MMNEPRYIVYSFKRSEFLHLDVIKWDTKEIWEIVEDPYILSHLKKLTIKKIDQMIGNSPYPVLSLDNIMWYRERGEPDRNLYKSSTIENIREVIETLEETKLSYMYFIYEPLKPLYMSNNCQSGQQARSTWGSK